jgi:Helix-turn-helix of DDE superfamily endonuclease
MLFYRAALPLSSRTLSYAAGDHPPPPDMGEVAVAKLNPAKQALLVLVYLRNGETFGELAAGFGISPTGRADAREQCVKLRPPARPAPPALGRPGQTARVYRAITHRRNCSPGSGPECYVKRR